MNTVYSGLKAGRRPADRPRVSRSIRCRCRTIQSALPANVLVVDTQGTELDVLSTADFDGVDLVIVETQDLSREMYAAFWPDAVEAMRQGRFRSGDPLGA